MINALSVVGAGMLLLFGGAAGTLWALIDGSGKIFGSLPSWALAVAGGGAVCLIVTGFLLKIPKLFFIPVAMIVFLAIQIGSADMLTRNPHEAVKFGSGQLPSFTDLTIGFSWIIVIGLALGGLVSIGMIAETKANKSEFKKY